jgi:hypothetical protein
MKRFFFALLMLIVFIHSSLTAKTRYEIKYSCERNEQTREYVSKLHEYNATFTRDSDYSAIIADKQYKLMNRSDYYRDSVATEQYDAVDIDGNQYVVCFKRNDIITPELKYQIIIFNTSNIYDWTYYFSAKPVEVQ